MATIYTTMQGEMVDMICRRIYGDESGYVERVLDANPRLAAMSIPLPIGTQIVLPDLQPAAPERQLVALWD
ncbi:MAG: tail protein X [Xanthobacteraceae bacterium]